MGPKEFQKASREKHLLRGFFFTVVVGHRPSVVTWNQGALKELVLSPPDIQRCKSAHRRFAWATTDDRRTTTALWHELGLSHESHSARNEDRVIETVS